MNNKIIIVFSFFLVLLISIGYGLLNENLYVNSIITLKEDSHIKINDVNNFTSLNGGYEKYEISYSDNSISSNIVLPNLNSSVTYDITILNHSNSIMKIKNITSVSNNDNIIYSFTNISDNSILEIGDVVNGTITFKYNDILSELPLNTELGIVIDFVFEEYVIDTYINNNLILDLRGIDDSINNVWYDRIDNKMMALTNVIDSGNKYTFNNTSYGSLNSPILPETGDFTLEVYLTLPNSFVANMDSAIVSQVSDTENDAGRFKLNIKYDKIYNYKLLTFVNSTKLNQNITYDFAINPLVNSDYLLQLVRKDNKLNLYLNGNEVSINNDFDITNEISQGPFKIGKWNSTSNQPYTGSIYSIRVYNRALDKEELINNREVDYQTYQSYNVYDTIKEYSISNYLENGLYNVENKYVYKGEIVNNYLKFSSSDDLYQIISFEENNTMKLINITHEYNMAFDSSNYRSFATSTYCTHASTSLDESTTEKYGCNAWNQETELITPYASGNVLIDSQILTYLNTTYYNSLPDSIKNRIIEHDFYTGFVNVNTNYNNALLNVKSKTWNGKIGLLTVADVLEASIDQINLNETNTDVSNYLSNLSSTYNFIWTMTAYNYNSWDVWAIARNALGKRRASRDNQVINDTTTAYFYVKPVIYVNSNIVARGNGTVSLPFIIVN